MEIERLVLFLRPVLKLGFSLWRRRREARQRSEIASQEDVGVNPLPRVADADTIQPPGVGRKGMAGSPYPSDHPIWLQVTIWDVKQGDGNE